MTARDGDSRLVRALRGGLAASSATFVALASHLAGGGEMPELLGIVVPLALSLPVCIAWAGQRLSLFGLSASVVASQLLFHLLFTLGAPAQSARVTTSDAGLHAGHEGMVMPTAAQAAGQSTEMAHDGAAMWVWHAVAAVVTIVVLYRGELMLLHLRDLAVRMASWLLGGRAVVDAVGSVVRPALPYVVPATFLALHPGPQLSSLRRRGPPAPHAV